MPTEIKVHAVKTPNEVKTKIISPDDEKLGTHILENLLKKHGITQGRGFFRAYTYATETEVGVGEETKIEYNYSLLGVTTAARNRTSVCTANFFHYGEEYVINWRTFLEA